MSTNPRALCPQCGTRQTALLEDIGWLSDELQRERSRRAALVLALRELADTDAAHAQG